MHIMVNFFFHQVNNKNVKQKGNENPYFFPPLSQKPQPNYLEGN